MIKVNTTTNLYIVLTIIVSGCVLISDRPESNEQTQIRHVRDEENLESGKSTNHERLLNEQWYQENVKENTKMFSHVEQIEKGCLTFFSGSDVNRKEIVPLLLPSLCENLYKYFVQAEIQCELKGPVSFPTRFKGKTIYWTLDNKSGSVVTDVNGKFRLTFVSAESFTIDHRISLYLDKKHTRLIPNKYQIFLAEDECLALKDFNH